MGNGLRKQACGQVHLDLESDRKYCRGTQEVQFSGYEALENHLRL